MTHWGDNSSWNEVGRGEKQEDSGYISKIVPTGEKKEPTGFADVTLEKEVKRVYL